jgi:catechol 1,2-dioxygenase
MIIHNIDMLTQAVRAANDATPNARLREVVDALVRHAHAFIREVKPSAEEFEAAIGFVTGIGQATTDTHNEVILASDILGFSSLVSLLSNTPGGTHTEAALLGPFWRENAPDCAHGDNIARSAAPGLPVVMHGQVVGADGAPIAGALVDVWQANPLGFYDNQDPTQEAMNLRGRFHSDEAGRFWFQTVRPAGYPVPTHGPCGDLLRAQLRVPYRPAHIHFMVSKPGHETLITQVFADDAEHLDNDVTFSVLQSLIAHFERHDSSEGAPEGVTAPWLSLDYRFVLQPGAQRFPTPPIR